MKQEIYELFQNTSDLSRQQIFLNITVAALIGFFIYLAYMISHRGTIYSRKFNASLVILTVLTSTVMTVIGNNIALSLGMVGALSIVRFRTAIKDSRDTVFIFWTVIIGICCGVGDFFVAGVGSVVTFTTILILGGIKNDHRILLIIRAGIQKQNEIKSLIYKIYHGKAVLRADNTTEHTTEMIFELSQSVWRLGEKEGNITDSLYALGNVEYVNTVVQDDEITA